ncbi:substrate-binding periplasmic protein [Eleftheria terrae]|uniref:substrate-binding periplasmic protein n=1 Tax=Eleftheria terrae TaxID=1597781 RepID=UPI00263B39BF|nr:transporter substrate-binding domain-containing protein [Eleftheria terrae]WKB51858.1 transporter substrate-binding domain-containing protein [Eleftheria terrae]
MARPIATRAMHVLGACLLVVAALARAQPAGREPQEVRYLHSESDSTRYAYYYALIELVLRRTDASHGPHRLKPYRQDMSSARLNREAIRGDRVNLHWSDAGHPELEHGMIPVPIPLDKGMLGHRVLLIRKQDQPRFARIRTLADLRRLRLGQGSHWGDNKVLRHNGIEVVEASRYGPLFAMLMAGRFDAFPRGANEAPQEYAARRGQLPGLQVEQTLVITYPMPVFFYVSKNSPALAERLRDGLEAMVADGSLSALFDRFYKDSLSSLRLSERTVIELENPFLPANVPFDRKELWLDLKNY